MTALFSRAFAPSHCMLPQLPAPLRQCSSLHVILLPSRQPTTALLSSGIRHFHPSPIPASRKPRTAVVRPSSAAAPPRQRPTSPPKTRAAFQGPTRKVQLPFQTHPPSNALPRDGILKSECAPPSPASLVPAPTTTSAIPTPSEPTTTVPCTPTPIPYAPAPLPYQGLVDKLATSQEPVVVYESQPQKLYIGVCISSALFLGWVATITWLGFAPVVHSGGYPMMVAGIISSGIWVLVASYMAFGPVGLIKRIVAVPAKPSYLKTAPKPSLRFEPFRLVFGISPKPFEIQLGNVYSDRSFTLEMQKIAHHKAQQGPPGVMAEYFGFVPVLFKAYLKMFARPQNFTYVRVYGRVNFKMDLTDCKAMHDGKGE